MWGQISKILNKAANHKGEFGVSVKPYQLLTKTKKATFHRGMKEYRNPTLYHSQSSGYMPRKIGKKTKHKQENITYIQEKMQSMKTSPKIDQMQKLAEKDYQSFIITKLT